MFLPFTHSSRFRSRGCDFAAFFMSAVAAVLRHLIFYVPWSYLVYLHGTFVAYIIK